jgi:hypothetical protein
MKTKNQPATQRSEGVRSIRRSNTADTDVNSYFLVRETSTREAGSATSESEVSPFGLSRSWVTQSSAIARRSEKPGESDRVNRKSEPTWMESPVLVPRKHRRDVVDWNDRRHRPIVSNEPPRHPADPPRPAKEGLEWVWFPEGYWAEREPKDPYSDGKQNAMQKWFNRAQDPKFVHPFAESPEQNQPRSSIPRIKIGSMNTNKVASKASSLHPSTRGSGSSFASSIDKKKRLRRGLRPSKGKKEGLYCRTKRTLESRFFSSKSSLVSLK